MKINLVELEHQRDALEALINAMPEVFPNNNPLENPLLENAGDENSFIDIKMETGTGKTYVYTRAMYELNRRFGLFKFIIVVPSLAIKEGTKNFICADYAKQHFSRFFPNKRIDLQLINAGDFASKKGKRKNFPYSIMQFCKATSNEKNTIQCLLISDKGFLDKSNSALFKDDYDQTIFGGYNCPIEAISKTRPIVIIDEPHRFKKEDNSYKNIISRIKPQMIIRFGATFPNIITGRGTNKTVKKDYYRNVPQYNLGAVEAFNKDLVKGVSTQFPSISEEELNIYKVISAAKDKLKLAKGSKTWEISVGEDLSDIGSGFHGDVTYEGNGKLSNELELKEGMELCEGIYTNSYQESLISQALEAHFEIEEKNFHREGYKVKTNLLFFIDSINSYRNDDGWLKTTFEKLLKNKLENMLLKYPYGEYHEFLLATKNNIKEAHGGYFAKDWGEPDDSAIIDEVQDILHKERTLPFKKENGKWNIRRFFFSKWTLREGWDNPNVFTICKLRSSGSENSKIQEVGRGLRLPVDEMGNRLSGEDWRLNFIISWNERDFATKLKDEINCDAPSKLDTLSLNKETIDLICKNRNIDSNTLLEELDNQNIINRSNDFKEGGFEKLLELYPELLQQKLKNGKVTTSDSEKPKIKLNKENWGKIRNLWDKISKRYLLVFERLSQNEIKTILDKILSDDSIFDNNNNLKVVINETQKSEIEITNTEKYKTIKNISQVGKLNYNEFVTKLSKQTLIPVQIVHECLWRSLCKFSDLSKEEINTLLNYNTLRKITELWTEAFAQIYENKYHYNSLNFKINSSIIKNENFVEEISQGLVGRFIANDIENDERNLYNKTAYDSLEPEHEIEKISPKANIAVFGKLPKCSIKIPTYTGGSTSPDFIFATEKDNKINRALLIETKSNDMRMSEERAVLAQEKLFANIPEVRWELVKNSEEVLNLLDDI